MTTDRLKKLLVAAMAANSFVTSARGDSQYRVTPRVATYGGRIDLGAANANTQAFAQFVPYTPITIVRFSGWATTVGVTCTAAPVLSLIDATTTSTLASVTFSNGITQADAGLLTVNITASHAIIPEWTQAAGTCATTPSGISFTVEYK